MPRGQSSRHRTLAHLLAAHSRATPKQAKEPIFATLDRQLKEFRKMDKFVFLIVFINLFLTTNHLFAQLAPIETKQQVYDRINAERLKIGMPTIPVNKKLERSAQSWAFFMRPSLKHNTNFLRR